MWLKEFVLSDESAKVIMFIIALDVRRQVTKLAKALTALETSHGTRLTTLEIIQGIKNARIDNQTQGG
jgi:hypothetical protein